MIEQLVPFIAAVGAFAVVGVVVGMLVARRLDRWAATADEEPGGDDGSDS